MKKINLDSLRKIPLVDFIGIAVFFSILFFAMFFFLRRSEYVTVTVKITDRQEKFVPWVYNETPEWYVQNIYPGLEEKDLLGKVNIRVDDIYYYPSLNTQQTVFLKLKIRTAYNRTTGQYIYKGTPLLIGGYNDFTVSGIKVPAIVTQIGDKNDNKSGHMIVKAKLDIRTNVGELYPANTIVEGVQKYISDKFVEGLEIYDSKGNVVTKIISVNKEPAYRSFTYQNYITKMIDPEREKVEFTMDVSTKVINGRHYYREEDPVFVGNPLTLYFDNFWVGAIVTEVLETEVQ